jgi:transposase InsO family protein
MGLTAGGVPMATAIKEVAASRQLSPSGKLVTVGARSIYRWLKLVKEQGFDGLFDSNRTKQSLAGSMPEGFSEFLLRQKLADDLLSIPEVIRRAKKEDLVSDVDDLSRTTVWRAVRRLDLPTTRRGLLKNRDIRRFAFKHRMQMVICDGKHFRAGPHRAKRVAMIFIDDATRYALHAVCGPSESAELFLRGLYELIQRHGLMTCLFVDNGSGFIAHDTEEICAKLGIKLIHGEVGHPEGRGKIERFNRTIKQDCLRHLDGAPGVASSFSSLELRINSYMKDDYGKRYQEGVEGIPEELFMNDKRPLTFPESMDDLACHFVLRESRKVTKDNCINIDGRAYEMPLGYAGTSQEIRRRVLQKQLLFLHQGELIELKVVDPHENAKTRRQKSQPPEDNPPPAGAGGISSSMSTYNEKYGSIIDQDGGFNIKEKDND